MIRDRSGLATTEPEKPKPGCLPEEVAARRANVAQAHKRAQEEVSGPEPSAPIFSDWRITTLADANRLCAEMATGIEAGEAYSVRVRKV